MKAVLPLVLLLSSLVSGCAFHSTANQWNGRVGENGEPVYVKSTSSVGLNVLVLVKLFGATNINGMIDELTEEIAEEGGDRVRIIESSTENYWYGFPPLTWIFTPVVTTVTADYEPTAEVIEADRKEQAEE